MSRQEKTTMRLAMVDQFRASGKTREQFCEEQGVAISVLRYWIAKSGQESNGQYPNGNPPAICFLRRGNSSHQKPYSILNLSSRMATSETPNLISLLNENEVIRLRVCRVHQGY